MTGLSNFRNARALWVIGMTLALSLTVVVPIHLGHSFLPACHTARTGLHAAHHTLDDQLAGRLEAQIDRAGRVAAPDRIAAAILAPAAPSVLPRATSGPPRNRMSRRLRIAPAHADDENPFSHTAFSRV